jgi:glucoamylase
MDKTESAPGHPGLSPNWTNSAKEMVGCGLGSSRLWYTLSRGVINEIYYPRIDVPQIRDMGFIVAGSRGFWTEVKALGSHKLKFAGSGIPAVEVSHHHARFRLDLRICPDPERDVLLIELKLEGDDDLRPYVLLNPHLGGTGNQNCAESSRYRGRSVIWAEQGPFGLALVAGDAEQNCAFGKTSAGYVGISDGWQDFAHNGSMQWQYHKAGPGNVALIGELPQEAVLALGFGSSKQSAATLAISALLQPFEEVWDAHVAKWRSWHAGLAYCAGLPVALTEELMISAMVLKAHQDKSFPGAMVASLSIPWGNTRDEVGGYHLVWPRDLAECAGALMMLGAEQDAHDILRYLIATQHEDGHWYQNQWLGGKPYWQGIQLDEAAFPVLLAAALVERNVIDGIKIKEMTRKALTFIANTGPSSDQDRWEESAGVNAFTLAVCIAALVAGAPFLDPEDAAVALDLADFWNAHVEDWNVVTDSPLQQQLNVNGYYIRAAPALVIENNAVLKSVMQIKNQVIGAEYRADELIGTDFLQLVRFGLRCADDPFIIDSLKVADARLKIDTPNGPCWRRYNGDGYGEHEDGSAYNGSGKGRAWPLLTGERGHYELTAGRDPLPYLEAMAAMAGEGGMIPEQVWDESAIPEKRLYPGRPTGSAMPLAWAHAEFVKLAYSMQAGYPVDRPNAVWARYCGKRPEKRKIFWLKQAPVSTMAHGTTLVIALPFASTVSWGFDGWQNSAQKQTGKSGLGLYRIEIDSSALSPGSRIDFTYRNDQTGKWAGIDFSVKIDG